MRAISSFFRFFAWIVMISVVFLLPLTLFGRAVGQLLFTEQGLSQAVSENLLDEEVFASIVEELMIDSYASTADAAPEEQYFSRVLTSLDHEHWVQVVSLVAPAELMRSTASDFFSGFYAWLEGEVPTPEFSVDLEPWKTNIESSKLEVVEIFLQTIPNCSPSEIVKFNAAQELPFCKPPEPHYSNLLAEFSTSISAALLDLPDEFSLFGSDGADQQEALEDVARLKQSMLLMRSILRYGWMIVFILFLVAIPMGARSLPGFFNWSGIPLFLAGLGALMLSFLIAGFGGSVIAGLLAPAFSEMPSAVVTPLNAVMVGVVTSIARPMLWQSIVLVVLGAGIVAVGIVIKRVNAQFGSAGGQSTAVMSGRAEQDDDASPSGMFG